MKSEDLERLKKLLKGTEFEVETTRLDFAFVAVKNTWASVEFVEYDGQLSCSLKRGNIYKTISDVDNGIFAIDDENTGNGYKKHNRIYFNPSTEEAYINQLKAKAVELYGEIKDQDKFEDPCGKIGTYRENGNEFNPKWDYIKHEDELFFYSILLYKEGQWAKKLPKRITILELGINFNNNEAAYNKAMSIGKETVNEYMTKQLEKLLNDEVE